MFYSVMYPNPGNGIFTINYTTVNNSNNILHVFDLMGKCVYNTTLVAGSNTNQINLSFLAKGLYVCKVSNDVVRFVKE